MDNTQEYVKRLMSVGYDERYARRLVGYYQREGSVEGLEEYIQTKERAMYR